MASYKVGTLALTTSDSGTKAVTGLGFTPKAVLFWTAGDSKSSATAGRNVAMFGASTGGAQNWCSTASARDNVVDGGSHCQHSSSLCIYLRERSDFSGGRYVMSSLDSDGYTLTVTEAVQQNITVNYLAIGGSDVSAYAGTITFPTTNIAFSTTSPGFTPNALIMAGTRYAVTASETWQGYGSGLTVGMTDGTRHAAVGWGHSSSATTNVKSVTATGSVIRLYDSDTTIDRNATFTSWDANGFTLTAAGTATSASLCGYLALILPNVYVGNDAMETTVTTFSQSSFGFQPAAVFAASAPNCTVSGTAADIINHSIGASDGTTSAWSNFCAGDNLATSDSVGNVGTAAILKSYERTGADTFSADAVVTLSAFDADGITFSQTDAAPAAGLIGYMAMGSGSSPSSGWLSTSRLQNTGRGVVSEMASRLGGVLEY